MFRPSHYLIHVANLLDAVGDYEAAGFCVIWGSEPDKAHNAFVYFDSGDFIELYTPIKPGLAGKLQSLVVSTLARFGSPLFQRAHTWFVTWNFADLCLECDDSLAMAAASARQRGVSSTKPRQFKRTRLDGVVTCWDLCVPMNPDLPFMIGPYTPAKTIGVTERAHPNGMRRILGVLMKHPKPSYYANILKAQLGAGSVVTKQKQSVLTLANFRFYIQEEAFQEYTALIVDEVPAEQSGLHGLRLISPSDPVLENLENDANVD